MLRPNTSPFVIPSRDKQTPKTPPQPHPSIEELKAKQVRPKAI